MADDNVIHHVAGERPFDRETCWCKCHDRTEDNHLICGASRDDEMAAITACERCRWTHAVAFSTKNWRNDESCMKPPAAERPEGDT